MKHKKKNRKWEALDIIIDLIEIIPLLFRGIGWLISKAIKIFE